MTPSTRNDDSAGDILLPKVNDAKFPLWPLLGIWATVIVAIAAVLNPDAITSHWQFGSRFIGNTIASHRTMTLDQLSQHTGAATAVDSTILISFHRHVFDVSTGSRFYGPGNKYSILAGKDSTRAFITGCFHESALTHDTRGLTAAQLAQVDEWLQFYIHHDTYRWVAMLSVTEAEEDQPMPDDQCGATTTPAAAATLAKTVTTAEVAASAAAATGAVAAKLL